MNKYLIAPLAALAFATPAAAQDFTGARVGVNLGLASDDFVGDDEFTYGAEVGYDFDTGGAVIGISGEVQDTDDTGRDLSATARVGGKVGKSTLVYVMGGYTNLKIAGFKFDGVRLGLGAEFKLGTNAFIKAEHRYSNYEGGGNDDFHQNLVGLGFRF